MNGLTLAREYYNEYGSFILAAAEGLAPGLSSRISAGLAGEGSQCFGYDDELSQDHDFAPGFCLWLSDADYAQYGAVLQSVYNGLPHDFSGFTCQNLIAPERLGVMSVSGFYGRLTGIPATEQDWLFLSEASLASATNGEIWFDGCHEFSSVRQQLRFYPDDVLRKKIAARAAVMSQSGQYNLPRVLHRGDAVAASLAAARFTEAAISMVHLLNQKYTPFYKWMFRSLQELSEKSSLAELTVREIRKLPEACILHRAETASKFGGIPVTEETLDAAAQALEITETICKAVALELNRKGFSDVQSSFLQDHLEEIMSRIKNPVIRSMHPMADPAF